jgi:hypothetical protein
MRDPNTVRSRTGFLSAFANCPLLWGSKLETEIALSSTKAEYVMLSTAAREMVPIMVVAKDAVKLGVIRKTTIPTFVYTFFEDNKGAVEMANVPKMHPRAKHMNIKYHFFRQFIAQKIFNVRHLAGTQQSVDILTKALDHATFLRHSFIENG